MTNECWNLAELDIVQENNQIASIFIDCGSLYFQIISYVGVSVSVSCPVSVSVYVLYSSPNITPQILNVWPNHFPTEREKLAIYTWIDTRLDSWSVMCYWLGLQVSSLSHYQWTLWRYVLSFIWSSSFIFLNIVYKIMHIDAQCCLELCFPCESIILFPFSRILSMQLIISISYPSTTVWHILVCIGGLNLSLEKH